MIDSSYQYIPGLITRVYGTLSGTPPAANPDDIKYDVRGYVDLISMQQVSVSLTDFAPTRRISVGAHVIPAQVDDPCWIIVSGGQTRLYVHEGVPFEEACP